jgi:hypothetical protein
MDNLYVQSLRYKLQKRAMRLNSCSWQVHQAILVHFYNFLRGHRIFAAMLDDLLRRAPSAEAAARTALETKKLDFGDNEIHMAALGWLMIKHCAEAADGRRMPVVQLVLGWTGQTKHEDNIRWFNDAFLEPLYEYLDEQLDDRGITLALLFQYKRKVEWFQRGLLYRLWEADTQRGEKNLALHLYEYLYDQGLQFFIEPLSASGEVDMVASQGGDTPLLADAKIFNPDKSKGGDYIARGFSQVHSYAVDYNESVAYLVVFKTSERDLKFSLPEGLGGIPYYVLNGKTVFFLVIDLFPHFEPASKRRPAETVEISEGDLTRETKAEP